MFPASPKSRLMTSMRILCDRLMSLATTTSHSASRANPRPTTWARSVPSPLHDMWTKDLLLPMGHRGPSRYLCPSAGLSWTNHSPDSSSFQQIPQNCTIDLGPTKLMDPSETAPPRPSTRSTIQVRGADSSTRTRLMRPIHFLDVMHENPSARSRPHSQSRRAMKEVSQTNASSRPVSPWEPEHWHRSLGQAFEIEVP